MKHQIGWSHPRLDLGPQVMAPQCQQPHLFWSERLPSQTGCPAAVFGQESAEAGHHSKPSNFKRHAGCLSYLRSKSSTWPASVAPHAIGYVQRLANVCARARSVLTNPVGHAKLRWLLLNASERTTKQPPMDIPPTPTVEHCFGI